MNKEAELLFAQIWWRTNIKFSDVSSFRRYTIQALPHVEINAGIEYHDFAQSLASDRDKEDLFTSKKDRDHFFERAGGIENFADLLAQKQIESYRKVIDTSSIILAHSALDAAAFDYFLVVEIVAPIQDLEKFVIRKQISLEDLKESCYDELMKQKIHKFIIELERKSLLEKIDKLFQICQPPPKFSPIRGYVYNDKKIEDLDNLRHEIVHGSEIDSTLPSCNDDIKYMQDTANFIMALVSNKYKIKIDPTALQKPLQGKSKT